MSIYKNGKLIAGGRQCMPLLSFMWADHVLNDVSWLRADTFSWQSGSVYVAVYSHLTDDISGKSLQSETISGTTVQFYVADDGHKICPASEESNVAAIYTATGVAWYYILDTVNQRFKLPRTQFGVTGLRDTVGNYVEAGLPNITGGTGSSLIRITGYNPTGALYGSSTTDSTWGGGSASTMRNLAFDASRSNSIYGNSTTVQPPATQMYLYFYVGSFTQTALENTAGLNASLFNDKAGVDLDNVSATGKATVVGWGMPDYSAGVEKSWANWTVDSDGYVFFYAQTNAGTNKAYINGGEVFKNWINNYSTGSSAFVPVKAGDAITVSGGVYQTAYMIFYPLRS